MKKCFYSGSLALRQRDVLLIRGVGRRPLLGRRLSRGRGRWLLWRRRRFGRGRLALGGHKLVLGGRGGGTGGEHGRGATSSLPDNAVWNGACRCAPCKRVAAWQRGRALGARAPTSLESSCGSVFLGGFFAGGFFTKSSSSACAAPRAGRAARPQVRTEEERGRTESAQVCSRAIVSLWACMCMRRGRARAAARRRQRHRACAVRMRKAIWAGVCRCGAGVRTRRRRAWRARVRFEARAERKTHFSLRRGLAAAARLAAALGGTRLPEQLGELRGLVLGKQPVLQKPSLRHLAVGPLLVQALVEEGQGVRLRRTDGAAPELICYRACAFLEPTRCAQRCKFGSAIAGARVGSVRVERLRLAGHVELGHCAGARDARVGLARATGRRDRQWACRRRDMISALAGSSDQRWRWTHSVISGSVAAQTDLQNCPRTLGAARARRRRRPAHTARTAP